MPSNDSSIQTNHPWQSLPTNLIYFAVNLIHGGGGIEQRIAYILLDVGVETTLRTFLANFEEITGTKSNSGERKDNEVWIFHKLLKHVEEVSTGRLEGINRTDISYFHNLRNKLYHQGNGITIDPSVLDKYSQLAIEILGRLLDVNLVELMEENKSEYRETQDEEVLELFESITLNTKTSELKRSLDTFRFHLELAIEKIEPKVILPSFDVSIKEIQTKYQDGYNQDEDIVVIDNSKHRVSAFINFLDSIFESIDTEFIKNLPSILVDEFLNDKYLFYLVLLDKSTSFDIGDVTRSYDEALSYPDKVRRREIEKDSKTTFVNPDTTNLIEEGTRLIARINQFVQSLRLWMAEEDRE